MMVQAYRYRFAERVDLTDAAETLMLAAVAAEGVFGETQVRLDARCGVDGSINAIVVDASTPVGRMLNSVFAAFVLREFGRDAVNIRQVELIARGGAA